MDNMIELVNQPQLNSELLKNFNLNRPIINADLQAQMADFNRITREVAEHRGKVDRAVIDTAQNTKEVNEKLDVIIENQNDYIELLKKQLADINYSIDILFNNVFDIKDISEESKDIAKAIYAKLITGDKFDFKSFIADKGADTFIQAIFFLLGLFMPK